MKNFENWIAYSENSCRRDACDTHRRMVGSRICRFSRFNHGSQHSKHEKRLDTTRDAARIFDGNRANNLSHIFHVTRLQRDCIRLLSTSIHPNRGPAQSNGRHCSQLGTRDAYSGGAVALAILVYKRDATHGSRRGNRDFTELIHAENGHRNEAATPKN